MRTTPQRGSRLRLVVVVVALLALVVPQAASAVRLVFDAPDELRPVAAQLAAIDPARYETIERFLGAPPSEEPIRVFLHPEDSTVARRTPAWVAGFAYSALDQVALFPERIPRYPSGSLEEVLRHEVAHVLLARAVAGRAVPRWFNEGVAMAAADPWGFDDRSRLAAAVLFRGGTELSSLDLRFQRDESVAGAYALSGAFVRELIRRHGTGAPARILSHVRDGRTFDDALTRATGSTLEREEALFWRRHSILYRWVPIVTSSTTLWVVITLLAVGAFRQRRRRDARVKELWELEEARERGWSGDSEGPAASGRQDDQGWIH